MRKGKIIPAGIRSSISWSVEFDGKSILALLALKPKMTYKEILEVIHAEGGYVDNNAIIHKGTAEEVLYTIA